MWRKLILICLILGFFGAGCVLLWLINLEIPAFDSFDNRVVTESTKIYDRTGETLLYDVHDNVKRKLVPFEAISKDIKNATVAIEDSEFYQHHGFQIESILRALWVNLGTGAATQGGSTITQQLVKNTLLTQEKKISRKIKEIALALKLEKVMSKEQILTLYLNENPYGGTIYGVEEAAETYFHKQASEVTLAEAAYLAAIPKAPTFYSPYGNNKDKLDERKNLVLRRMKELGFITEDEEKKAASEKVAFSAAEDGIIKAPHFVMMVKEYLENKYGEAALRQGGLKVITTIDWGLQEQAEKIVKEYSADNITKFNAHNAGLVAIDPTTGQILALVGSRDYFDKAAEGNFNITTAHRQPGSSFKPFVYSTAFNKGYTPETVVFDVETQFDTSCKQNSKNCYTPSNYDDKFRGPMALRDALAQSINIPAIKMLYLAGIKDSLATAKSMGITSLTDPNRYGLTLVLGGGEVSLLEMTSAYSVFANDGIRNPYASILKIEDKTGNALEEFTPSPRRALPEQSARLITSILADNQARVPSYGVGSPLQFGNTPVAVKTGTTNDYKDAWILGYTPKLAVGAWAGNNDNTPMVKKTAGLIISPLWHAFMEKALVGRTAPFPTPSPNNTDLKPVLRGLWQGGESYFVDKISQKLATEYTPDDLREERVITNVHSILYWVDRDDPLGLPPAKPESDPQFKLWEEPVRAWALQHGYRDGDSSSKPTAADDVHRPEYAPEISITSPSDNDRHKPGDRVLVSVRYKGRYDLDQLDVFLNDTFLGSVKRAPFTFSFTPNEVENINSTNTLRVVAYDTVRNKGEAEMEFGLAQ